MTCWICVSNQQVSLILFTTLVSPCYLLLKRDEFFLTIVLYEIVWLTSRGFKADLKVYSSIHSSNYMRSSRADDDWNCDLFSSNWWKSQINIHIWCTKIQLHNISKMNHDLFHLSTICCCCMFISYEWPHIVYSGIATNVSNYKADLEAQQKIRFSKIHEITTFEWWN